MRRATRQWHPAVGGAIAGLRAGIVSSVPGLAHAALTRRGIWEPIRLIASTAGLPAGRSFAPVPVAVGGAIHMGLSAGYGALYASTLRTSTSRPVLQGAAYGLALHALNLRIVTRLSRFSRLRDETNEWVELLAHGLYGAALGVQLRSADRSSHPHGPRVRSG